MLFSVIFFKFKTKCQTSLLVMLNHSRSPSTASHSPQPRSTYPSHTQIRPRPLRLTGTKCVKSHAGKRRRSRPVCTLSQELSASQITQLPAAEFPGHHCRLALPRPLLPLLLDAGQVPGLGLRAQHTDVRQRSVDLSRIHPMADDPTVGALRGGFRFRVKIYGSSRSGPSPSCGQQSNVGGE